MRTTILRWVTPVLVWGLLGCGGRMARLPGEISTELGAAVLAGTVNATESDGSMASAARPSPWWKLGAWLNPVSTAWAAAVCPTVGDSACSPEGANGVITLTYASCSFGSSAAVWSGGQTLTFTGGSICNTQLLAQAGSFTRTFAANTTRTAANGTVVTLSSADTSGWENPVTGGVNVVVSNPGPDVERAITVNGLHLTAPSTRSGGAANGGPLAPLRRLPIPGRGGSRNGGASGGGYDHSVSGAFTVLGRGPNRTVPPGGNMTVQHNLARYTSSMGVQQTLTFTAGCCHPTGGTVVGTLSGGRSGTEFLEFHSTCGEATLNGDSLTLHHCF